MRGFLAVTTTLLGLVPPATCGDAPAAAAGGPLKVRGGLDSLVVPGDRAEAAYTVYSGSRRVEGTLYVRRDEQRTFARVPLTRSNGYRARIAPRFMHGKRLFYYAVFRDPRGGGTLTVPAHGADAPATAWVLARPIVVRLGVHRFGRTRTPEAVVARGRADEVGWDINPDQGFDLGPQTLQVGSDGSVWLEDSFNNRLLVWNPGSPESFARTVPVPYGAGISDVAFGPADTVYVTRKLVDPVRLVVDRLDARTGRLLWERRVGLAYGGGPTGDSYPVIGSDSPLRVGPDGTLYYLVFMGLPGDEWGWMPIATPSGRPIAPRAQVSRIRWPFQPVAGGLRLVGPEYGAPHRDQAPHEVRYALVDGSGRLVRAWRIVSRTKLDFIDSIVPDLVGGDPVVVLDFAKNDRAHATWEYEVLHLGRHGASTRFSLTRDVWGDTTLDDLRVGPDGKLYQLATSPLTGIVISRYSLR